MSSIQPVTRLRHAAKSWNRVDSYSFASARCLVPLSGVELSKAVMSLPIAFALNEGAYVPVAVLGLADQQNLYVDSTGEWLGGYVPAELRSYPFLLARSEDGQRVLCVDEGSGLVVDGGAGEQFFNADGSMTTPLQSVFGFVSELENGRAPTLAATEVLQKLGLIQPWELAIDTGSSSHRIGGLHRIDAQKMDNLSDEEFVTLRQHGALLLAYLQAMSVQHMSKLVTLSQARAAAAKASEQLVRAGELDLGFMQSDTIRF
ncbi:MAG: SapC family protein [Ramlibacter sp.]